MQHSHGLMINEAPFICESLQRLKIKEKKKHKHLRFPLQNENNFKRCKTRIHSDECNQRYPK